jgi:hypothetical protein
MKMVRFWIMLAVLLLSIVVYAQDEAARSKKVVFKKTEKHKFSGLRLKGLLKKPELSYIYQRKGIRSEKIVDTPEDFNQEIRSDAGKF